MCIAIVAFQIFPDWPVFVAANRDEAYDRPSSPPSLDDTGPARLLAPRDLRAGGTWIGLNENRVYAVITNRSDLDETPPPGSRSRGLRVLEALRAGSLDRALETVREGLSRPSAPFNLLLGDPDRLYLVEHASTTPRIEELGPGTAIASNRGGANDESVGEIRRARREWAQAIRFLSPWDAGRKVLTLAQPSRNLPPLLRRGAGHGTVASTLLGIDRRGEPRFEHAHGSPDEVPYESHGFA